MIQIGVSSVGSIHLSSIQEDFDQMKADPLNPRKATQKAWELVYDPDLLVEVHGVLRTSDFALKEEALKYYAEICTKLRSDLRQDALLASQG